VKAPRIRTTVVGSYPVPDWLAAAPSEQALADATRVVIATQEQAGIDLVCDGELYRFDLNHPETNGMIEYFTRPMSGIRSDIGFAEWLDYTKAAGMRFRARPPGVVTGPVEAGTLNLPIACARARSLASRPLKFTITGPHMLAKTLHDRTTATRRSSRTRSPQYSRTRCAGWTRRSCSSTRPTFPAIRRNGSGLQPRSTKC
jgi:5-methyltetrahydropteroyltriglutamate--homocysteine methyltransferase